MNRASNYLSKIFLGVLAYIPFHALITTWIISNYGYSTAAKGAKDILVLLLFIALSAVFISKSKNLSIKNPIALCFFITLLAFDIMLISALNKQPVEQSLAGLLIFFRPLWILLAGITAAAIMKDKNISSKSVKIIIYCSIFVIAFGALQVLVLPKDFLSAFGYGPETIKPYQTIDNNESFVRILSTLRGPNPLGAYLAMVAPIGLFYAAKIKSKKYLKITTYVSLFIITIYGAQSRSAWLGLIIGLITYLAFSIKNKRKLIQYLAPIAPILIAGFLLRNTNIVQNVVFHEDPGEGSSINSDDQRISSLKFALDAINEKPFGHGIGSSGPASNYGDNPVIIENQYLDVAYQVGWVGLAAYLGILISVGALLLKNEDKLSYALFAGLVAVSVIALFWPVWTDETVAFTWWGLAGVVLSSHIVQKTKKQ